MRWKKSTQKLLSLVLTLAMLVSMVPAVFAAEGDTDADPVDEIVETAGPVDSLEDTPVTTAGTYSLGEDEEDLTQAADGTILCSNIDEVIQAITNAENDAKIIRLSDNITDISRANAITINDGQKITIDLNGYNWNGLMPSCQSYIKNNGSLTIMDSAGNGRIQVAAFNSIVTIENSGTLNLNGGLIDGTAQGGSHTGIVSSGNIIISEDATVSGAGCGLEVIDGTASICGGTLKSALGKDGADGYGLSVAGGSVTVTDGNVSGISNTSTNTAINVTGGSISITGGTFSSDVSAYVPQGYTYNSTTGAVTAATPVDTYVAEVNGIKYTTLAEAINAAASGDTVILLADILLDPTAVEDQNSTSLEPLITINKNLTLDLSGYSIKLDQTKLPGTTEGLPYTPVVFAVESAVTITGDGMIDAEAGYNNSYGINVNGGSLTIESGTFTGAPTAVQVQTGSLTINGGSFDLASTIKLAAPGNAKYIINAIDTNWQNATAQISIAGGTFGYNYSAYPAEGTGTYLADGYEMVENTDGTYGVQVDTNVYVAQVGSKKYKTLADAIDAAQAGDTITLLDNVSISEALTISCGVTIDGGNFTVTDSTGILSPAIKIESSDTVTVQNLTLDGAARGFDLLNSAAKLSLTDCTLNVSERGITCSLDAY
ncbi:MAG: hypothetical protein Q4P84_08980, partial [Elusimicrobiales bacterium]|nr:hypothetical protein [Elusimicrobiales bacterium]